MGIKGQNLLPLFPIISLAQECQKTKINKLDIENKIKNENFQASFRSSNLIKLSYPLSSTWKVTTKFEEKV